MINIKSILNRINKIENDISYLKQCNIKTINIQSINMSGDALRTKSIIAQFVNATKCKDDSIQFALDEDNVNIWYIRIHNIAGDEDEFKGGEYLFRIHIPNGAGKTWISKPPRFIALTPNGIFKRGEKCCIHIGEYHRGAKTASLGVGDFAIQLLSGMVGWRELTHGINLINKETTLAQKKQMAKDSVEYNRKHYAGVLEMLDRQYAEYSKKFIAPDAKEKPTLKIKELMNTVKPAINPKYSYDERVDRKKESNGAFENEEKPEKEKIEDSSDDENLDE